MGQKLCTGHIPIVQGLIERGRLAKDRRHDGHIADVPTVQRLIECRCSIEHGVDVGYARNIPIPNGLIETRCPLKHAFHCCHAGHVPTGDVRIEGGFILEQFVRTRHKRRTQLIQGNESVVNSSLQGGVVHCGVLNAIDNPRVP